MNTQTFPRPAIARLWFSVALVLAALGPFTVKTPAARASARTVGWTIL